MITPLKNKRWHRLKRAGLLITVCLTILFVSFYLLIVYKPSDYNPRPLSKLEQVKIATKGDKDIVAYIYNNVQKTDPFTLTIEQTLLNQILLLKDTRLFFPLDTQIQDIKINEPQIRFSEDSACLLTQITYKEVSFIVTFGLKVIQTDNEQLKFEMLPVYIGALRIPKLLIKDHLKQIAKQLQEKQTTVNDTSGDDLETNIYQVISEVITFGVAYREPVLKQVSDKNIDARIKSFKIGNGSMKLDILSFRKQTQNNQQEK